MKHSIFWHRRDLRIEDNAGLFFALTSDTPVQPIFIFDTNILNRLDSKKDARVCFIHSELEELKKVYQQYGSDLLVYYGNPSEIWKKIVSQENINEVYFNHDIEPYAIQRDNEVRELLEENGVVVNTFKDHMIFEKHEVTKDDNKPYTVFTPYSKKWKLKLNNEGSEHYPSEKYLSVAIKVKPTNLISLSEMGFMEYRQNIPSRTIDIDLIRSYDKTRDIPSISGTSRLSVHLRFGTVSIRKLVQLALKHNEKWLNELIWRDFYMSILYHFPHVVESSFKKKYDNILWRNNEEEFQLWCKGLTGYPIVDAGMRELNETGFMHNRVRMITAGFLVKHLLIDWKWGETYFASKLLDLELSSNNGGWQWASGSGCDAAPYFRVFNPYIQTKKFDPDLDYIKKWVPEFDDPFEYPKPIVEHKFARERAISTYKRYLTEAK